MHGSRTLVIGKGLKYTLDMLMTKPATDQCVAGPSCRSVDRTLKTASIGMVDSFVADIYGSALHNVPVYDNRKQTAVRVLD